VVNCFDEFIQISYPVFDIDVPVQPLQAAAVETPAKDADLDTASMLCTLLYL